MEMITLKADLHSALKRLAEVEQERDEALTKTTVVGPLNLNTPCL